MLTYPSAVGQQPRSDQVPASHQRASRAHIPAPAQWAETQWGSANLGDARLTRRAVSMGASIARRPQATLPQQMRQWPALKAAYRFLDNTRVSFEALSRPHWQQSYAPAQRCPVVLLLQDITDLNYSHYSLTMKGLGPIGNGKGWGLYLHSTLAVVPAPRQIVGLLHQQIFTRVSYEPAVDQTTLTGKSKHEIRKRLAQANARAKVQAAHQAQVGAQHPTQVQRQAKVRALAKRKIHLARPRAERESRVWSEAVRAIGPAPKHVRWVVVADRGADQFVFLTQCRDTGLDYVVRMTYERRLLPLEPPAYLLTTMRAWSARVGQVVEIQERGGRPARQARVLVSAGPLQIRVPCRLSHNPQHPGLSAWGVRVWEVDPPADIEEPLEWFLLTSVPVNEPADMLERVAWYRLRPLIEDYHQGLKTGAHAEERDLEDVERIKRLLGFLAPVAVRLLQLRDTARLNPKRPAREVMDARHIRVLAAELDRSQRGMTVDEFWRGVAQLGGYLGRRRDGPPGWKTLWRGWFELEALVHGAELGEQLADGP